MSFAGALIGLMLGHLIAELTGQWLWREHQLHLSGLTWLSGEFYLVVLSLGTGMMAALLQAIQAYRVDVSEVLSKGSYRESDCRVEYTGDSFGGAFWRFCFGAKQCQPLG